MGEGREIRARERVTVGRGQRNIVQGREVITSDHKKERAERDSSVEKEEDARIKERKYKLTGS